MPDSDPAGGDAESLRQLVAGAAHDLNNLLVVVTGCAELALDDESLTPHVRDLLVQILDVAGRARTLSNRCLLAGHAAASTDVVDVASFMRSSSGVMRRLAGDTVTVQIEAEPRPVWIRAETSQLEQVIFNLAVNAREAMPDGGRLTMAVALAEVSSASGALRVARLIVSDTGRGIDPGVRDRMFEPRVTTKPASQGPAGLGLSVVRDVVARLGGEIDVISARGVGTTFVVDLPLAGPPPS